MGRKIWLVGPETFAVLHAIERLYDGNGGWPVHVREVCREAGRTVSTVHSHLRKLEEAGLIEKGPYKTSGWRPT